MISARAVTGASFGISVHFCPFFIVSFEATFLIFDTPTFFWTFTRKEADTPLRMITVTVAVPVFFPAYRAPLLVKLTILLLLVYF